MADATRAVYLRGLDQDTYRWLKVRAAQHDRSMQAELRAMILEIKQADESADNSAGAMFRKLREQYGTFDEFEIPSRAEMSDRTVDFSE